MIVRDLEESTIATARLRLRFTRLRDRWTHAIEVRRPNGFQVVAAAVEMDEGPESSQSVISPTYQDLELVHEEADAVALLVGQWGSHHFSGVFRVNEGTPDDPGDTIVVDVAHRCRQRVGALACAYRLSFAPVELVDADASGAIWEYLPGPCYLNLTTLVDESTPAQVSLGEFDESGSLLQIEARRARAAATQRCRFAWSIVES